MDVNEVANKYFGLSDAYLAAACALAICHNPANDANQMYYGSACMFNARLAVELFLKGMIVLSSSSAKVGSHKLEDLAQTFASLYTKPECRWDVPFTAQVIQVGSDSLAKRNEAIKEVIKNRPLDQVFRYPTNNKGQCWELVDNLDFQWFLALVEKIRTDTNRIKVASGYASIAVTQ